MLEMMLSSVARSIYQPDRFIEMNASNPPTSRINGAVAQLGKEIYVLGGISGNTYQDKFYRWSETTNTWVSLASFPEPIQAACMVAAAGKIYAFGGINDTLVYNNSMYRYTPETNVWIKLAAAPNGTVGYASSTMFTYGREVFILGGSVPAGQGMNTLSAFNIDTNTWRTRANFPDTLQNATGIWIDNKYYVTQGASSTAPNRRIVYYEPVNDRWVFALNVNGVVGTRYGCAIAEFDRVIYLIGSNAPTMESFNTVSLTFKSDAGPYPTMTNSFNARSAKIGSNNYLLDLMAPNILIYKWG